MSNSRETKSGYINAKEISYILNVSYSTARDLTWYKQNYDKKNRGVKREIAAPLLSECLVRQKQTAPKWLYAMGDF